MGIGLREVNDIGFRAFGFRVLGLDTYQRSPAVGFANVGSWMADVKGLGYNSSRGSRGTYFEESPVLVFADFRNATF